MPKFNKISCVRITSSTKSEQLFKFAELNNNTGPTWDWAVEEYILEIEYFLSKS